MANIDYWLQQKYDILRQNAESDATKANAYAMGLRDPMSKGLVATQNPDAIALAGLTGAGAPVMGATPGAGTSTTASTPPASTDDMLGKKTKEIQQALGLSDITRARKGKTKIVDKDGNGSPTEDTVPAMLAEGEAVLNAGAAELMGRDKIRELNKSGLRMMGMPEDSEPVVKEADEKPGYKYGIDRVMTMKDPVGYMCGTSNVKKGAVGYNKGTDYVGVRNMRVHAVPGWEDVKNFGSKAADLGKQAAGKVAGAFSSLGGAAAPEAAANTGRMYEAGKSMGQSFQSTGSAVNKALGGLPESKLGKLGAIGAGAAAAGDVYQAANSQERFFNDPAVPQWDKAKQAARTGFRAVAPLVTTVVGSGMAPVVGTVGGMAAGATLRGMVDEEGEALTNWRKANPAAPKPTKAEQPAKKAGGGLRTVEEYRGTERSQSVFDPSGKLIARVPDTIYAPPGKAGAGGSGEGKGKIPNATIVDPVTGKEDKLLTAQFEQEFLPNYARAKRIPAKKLTEENVADALSNFRIIQQANKAGLESGRGFNLTAPATQYEWVNDLPSLTGGQRGENTMWQGVRDNLPFTAKGGLRITSGGQGGPTQVIPANMLDLSDPGVYKVVQDAKKTQK